MQDEVIPKMDADVEKHYQHLLDMKEIEPTDEERKINPYAKAFMPPLPLTVQRMHARFALYFRRLYNREVERAHLPMIAAMAMELETLQARFLERPDKKPKVA